MTVTSWGTRVGLSGLGARHERVSIAGWELVVHRLGRPGAEPWVLLHGMGATALSWARLLPSLARTREIVLPELSCLGGSRGPAAALGPRAGGEIVAALLARLFPERPVTLGGTSLGAWIAVRAALAHPAAIARLALFDAAGLLEQDWEAVARAVRIEDDADARRFLSALLAAPPWILRRFPQPIRWIHQASAVRSVVTAIAVEDAYSLADLRQLAIPTGLFWGERDGIFPISVGEAMAAALPRARLWRFADSAHAPQWESPRAVLAALAELSALFPVA